MRLWPADTPGLHLCSDYSIWGNDLSHNRFVFSRSKGVKLKQSNSWSGTQEQHGKWSESQAKVHSIRHQGREAGRFTGGSWQNQVGNQAGSKPGSQAIKRMDCSVQTDEYIRRSGSLQLKKPALITAKVQVWLITKQHR